jgi:RNA-directed DNA polymerase
VRPSTNTRLLDFRPPPAGSDPARDTCKRSFEFLGFTHHWARSRRGPWVVRRKTASNRFSRALRRTSKWFRAVRHQPLAWQHGQLVRKLAGHDTYYGISGSFASLCRLRYDVRRLWRKWLDRRSDTARMTWARFRRVKACFPLPSPIGRVRLGHCAANP